MRERPRSSSLLPSLSLLAAVVVSAPLRAAEDAGPAAVPAEDAGAEGSAATEACEQTSFLVYLDDVPYVPCEGLFGDLEDRALYRGWRDEYLHVVDTGGPAIDIVHGVAGLEAPRVVAPAGMRFEGLRYAAVAERPCEEGAPATSNQPADATDATSTPEPTKEWLAVFALDDSLAGYCPSQTVLLRADDALGAAGRVLFINPRGVLALLGERLVWLPAPEQRVPAFRMTWRSGFRVVTSASGGGSSTPAAKKAPPKRPRKKPARKPRRKR